jgi:hypothetical protein
MKKEDLLNDDGEDEFDEELEDIVQHDDSKSARSLEARRKIEMLRELRRLKEDIGDIELDDLF